MVRVSVYLRFALSGSPTLRSPLSPLSPFPGTHPLPFFRKDFIPKGLLARVCKNCDSKGVTGSASQSHSRCPAILPSAAHRQASPSRLACPERSRREQCQREPRRRAAPSLPPYVITSLLQSRGRNLHALRSPLFLLSPFSVTSIPHPFSLAPFCHRPISCKPCLFNPLQTLSIVNRGGGCAPPLSLQVLLEFQNETTTPIRLRGSPLQLRHTVGRSRRIPLSSASALFASRSSPGRAAVFAARVRRCFFRSTEHESRNTEHGTPNTLPETPPPPPFSKRCDSKELIGQGLQKL